MNSMIVAFLVAAVSLLAYTDRKRAGIRYIISALAVWLLVAGLVMPHEALGTILHDVGVAVLLGFVSLWAPAKARSGEKPGLSTT
jgi:nucleoside permease NupC